MAEGWSAVELSEAFRSGARTAVSIAQEALDRQEAAKDINAFLELDADDVLAQARRLDERRAAGEALGRLAAVPVAIKDNIAVEGQPLSCASQILEGFESVFDATAVERLRAADAIIFGRAAMDELAMGSTGEFSVGGPTKNPHDPERVPGGSSSGSAAAVAAGIVPLALGSDTGGSVRLPASLCACVGLKPSYGRVSRSGLVACASSLDQIGPIAADVADTALLYEVLAGYDPKDSTSLDLPVAGLPAELPALKGLRVGIVPAFEEGELEPTIAATYEHAKSAIEAAGAELVEVKLAHIRHAVATYYTIVSAEASSNLARYDGVHYGWRDPDAQTPEEVYTRTRTLGFGSEVRRRILLGNYILSGDRYEAYYERARKVRTLIIRDFESAFERCDVIFCPTNAAPPAKLGEQISDRLAMYLQDLFTIPANLAGIPALSLPIGTTTEGLPVGAQIMAKAGAESELLGVAARLEELMAGGQS